MGRDVSRPDRIMKRGGFWRPKRREHPRQCSAYMAASSAPVITNYYNEIIINVIN